MIKILLVGNYITDRLESMNRFAEMLERALPNYGYHVEILRPTPLFGRLRPTYQGIGKWLGYIDKYLVFPFVLRVKSRSFDIVHVCDHSNAMYLAFISPKARSVVTCHDMLSVRGAFGEDTDCPSSPTGKILQRWIRFGLGKADVAACVSTYTLNDVYRLVRGKPGFQAKLALNGLNHSYGVLQKDETERRLGECTGLDPSRPYVLHVGSNLRRKNREGVIRAFCKTIGKWQGQLVFAGLPLTPELKEMVRDCGMEDRVVEVVDPSNRQLEALYNAAHVFFFPSRFEGFGWPIIEAQASGCPVVCSTAGPFREVTGGAALIREVDDEDGFAEDILNLSDRTLRQSLIRRGLENVERFTAERMAHAYHEIYADLIGGRT
jgi:glycosyltransferase involved in cell wall biosynthesis